MADANLRILVVGAGAVGGYFGAKLAKAGRDVTFLVRPGRAKQLRESGLQIVSPHHGDFTISPQLLDASEIRSAFDVILLSVKAYALDAAIKDFAPAIGPDSMILPVLNGMKHMDALEAHFGASALLGGVCLVATQIDSAGRIVQLGDFHKLVYGERQSGLTPRIQALDAAMQGAGFDARASETITPEMWEKWVMLSSLGAVNCLMRGPIGQIAAAPGGVDFAKAMLAECVSIATAYGYPPSDEFLARHSAALTALGSPTASSMFRDLRQNAPVEAEQILGDLAARGQAKGIPAPLLNAAYTNLCIYQSSLK